MSDEIKLAEVYILIDKSGSMDELVGGTTNQKDMTRDMAVREDVVRHLRWIQNEVDTNGATVILFGRRVTIEKNVTAERVMQLYQEVPPIGSTPMAEALDMGLTDFEREGKPNGRIMLRLYTDGAPDNPDKVVKFFVDRVFKGGKGYDPEDEFAAQFIQVGHDTKATNFLEFLDNTLKNQLKSGGRTFDYVDVKNFEDVYDISPKELYVAAFED